MNKLSKGDIVTVHDFSWSVVINHGELLQHYYAICTNINTMRSHRWKVIEVDGFLFPSRFKENIYDKGITYPSDVALCREDDDALLLFINHNFVRLISSKKETKCSYDVGDVIGFKYNQGFMMNGVVVQQGKTMTAVLCDHNFGQKRVEFINNEDIINED